MSFKMPHTSLYLRQLTSGKPSVNTIQSKMATKGATWNQFTVSQRCSLRLMGEQQASVYPIHRRWVHSAPAEPETSPIKEDKAKIVERETEPTDKGSWSRRPDGLWLHSVTVPSEQGKEAKEQVTGPYIKTEEGFVHIQRYYPDGV
ncbi:hypothetical protein VPNG_04016 [Cytospora leucostoma]|uniref:Uncharacterized protein n=1 Tax=Cytospora leucostoma TaxID=1230097 RepID=A0A423XD90_9PEZI|nr:hypothetical protein VPNG_04016 [Cytospora leucostoma]